MPGINFTTVCNEISMRQVLAALEFFPNQQSRDRWRGPCPVHQSRPTSRCFSVNLALQRYYCHKCGSHGNQLELWSAVQQQTLYQAAQTLCDAVGLPTPWIHRW